jgi:hypothetical protein
MLAPGIEEVGERFQKDVPKLAVLVLKVVHVTASGFVTSVLELTLLGFLHVHQITAILDDKLSFGKVLRGNHSTSFSREHMHL